MSDVTSRKSQLRSELRRRRHALEPARQLAAADSVARHVLQLPAWPPAQRIAVYLAADDEIDTTPLSNQGRALGKRLYLPVIEADDSLTFAEWPVDCQLSRNRYGILEPLPPASRCAAAELDILFMPLVGWDRQGGRLGMGGGFYDRTLSGVSGPVLVGLAHTVQEIQDLPREDWDIQMDFIATDMALYDCREAVGSLGPSVPRHS